MIVRYKKAATWEMFFSQAFTFAKLAVLFCFAFMDNRLATLYGIVCLILWVVLLFPKYSGPSNLIQIENKDHFYDLITNPNPSSDRKKSFAQVKSTVLICNANWIENCLMTYPIWANWSL